MTWIQLEDGNYAEEATPDPRRVLTFEELAQEKLRKERELDMYEQEIVNLTERKTAIEAEILEITNLLNPNV